MWCTRWFLPLLLLPLPTASPYFLFLFFCSLTLHARPCFYCIILLTALFTSSCYWQPVPTHSLLQTAFPNISSPSSLLYMPNITVSDNSSIPPSNLLPVPRMTMLLDRCWCDLSSGHLFDPYNMTLWQLTSLSRTLGTTNSQRRLDIQAAEIISNETDVGQQAGSEPKAKAWVLTLTDETPSEGESAPRVVSSNRTSHGWFRRSLWPLSPFKSLLSFPSNVGQRSPAGSPSLSSLSPPSSPTPVSTSSPERNGIPEREDRLPLIRRTYDLRSHKIDLIIDLGWGRSYDY